MQEEQVSRPDFSNDSSDGLFWRLPETLRILRGFVRQADFAQLCLLSRQIYDRAVLILCESITLKVNNAVTEESFRSLRDLLCQRPELAASVHELNIQLLTGNGSDGPQSDAPSTEVLPLIIQQCIHLQRLEIWLEFFAVKPSTKDLELSLAHSSALTHLGVFFHDISWVSHNIGQFDINTTLLSQALALPNLTFIALTLQEGPESPLYASELPANGSVRHLRLDDAYIRISVLRRLIGLMSQLQRLELDLTLDANPIHNHVGARLDCAELGEALLTCAPNLEHLKVAVRYVTRTALDVGDGGGDKDTAWGPIHTVTTLRSLTCLRSLEIAPELILGWNRQAIGLARLLPSSLTELCLRFDFGTWFRSPWDFASLCTKVQEYLGDSQRAPLEVLTMTYFEDDEDEIKIELRSLKAQCSSLDIDFYLMTVPAG